MSSALPAYDSGAGPRYYKHPRTPLTANRSTYRRRRIVWSAILLFAAFCGVLYIAGWSPTGLSLSSSLKDSGYEAQDAPVYAANASEKTLRIQEIHGLLHFLTSERTESMSLDRAHAYGDAEGAPVDWGAEQDLSVFSAGVEDDNWPRNVRELTDRYPVVVFSKTYCPFSKRAKALLESYQLTPPPKIIEVDLRPDGGILKQLLGRLTGRATFPNVLLTRRVEDMSIGGSDDIHALHENGALKGILGEAGVKVNGP
ncbi:thioredoxin-like protein [Gloeophyllum trabeum ATCC 11539]|uniref:Thioredoxin-like protein n=1 Tax=Gloeophyllum trabeum (strain ATCC 11539 / FP-39264 / Madison 617) TaxID=670483 RepID=S7RV96_GLOTA|nr:thioredoxin-like protein [Gloeophyllum trabeum ATCC 11539]EPQ57154.1 thioredoxin-like protein [Gloeophyllum trabeum ATCC 11539]